MSKNNPSQDQNVQEDQRTQKEQRGQEPLGRPLEFVVSSAKAGLRLDRFLSQCQSFQSRNQIHHLIMGGQVQKQPQQQGQQKESQQKQPSSQKSLKPSTRVQEGEVFHVFLSPPKAFEELKAFHFPLDIYYEDEDLLVVNKLAGMVVHPGAGHREKTLVQALLAHTPHLFMGNGEERAGLVHRLDKDTSGLLVVCKNAKSYQSLSSQFKERKIFRCYHALVLGKLAEPKGTIKSFLSRHPVHRKKWASVRNEKAEILRGEDESACDRGKFAITHYQLLSSYSESLSYLKLQLSTGRTHQIRVHLSELGHPLIQDPLYGGKLSWEKRIKDKALKETLSQFPTLTLHARELGFFHPRTQKFLFFLSPWPKKMEKVFRQLGF